jgi:transcriptional regulator with XRE-family HTH domain
VTAKRSTRPAITSPDLGLIVRLEREAQHLSQAELAEKAGMRIAQLSSLENGHNVEIRFYEACATALGFDSAAEMFAGNARDRVRLVRQVKAQVLRDLKKALS